jgi:hypothetical protein
VRLGYKRRRSSPLGGSRVRGGAVLKKALEGLAAERQAMAAPARRG